MVERKEIWMKKKAPPITIWIHGTFFFEKKYLPSFFYCKDGLNLATNLPKSYYHRTIAETISAADPEEFPLETFYLFGWSGKLSRNARKKAAEKLATDLKEITTIYKKIYGITPSIKIITHSHGGNVALNLASIPHYAIDIEKLILLGCPVQKESEAYIKSPLFKSAISLFSHLDLLQRLDPQGLSKKIERPFFSKRTFTPQTRITQAQINTGNRGLLHIEFMLKPFLRMLPSIIHYLTQLQSTEETISLSIENGEFLS